MALERTIAAFASSFLIGICATIASAQDIENNKPAFSPIPLSQRGFSPSYSHHHTWKIPVPKSKNLDTVTESIFYYNINGNIIIEYVRNGKVQDIFVCDSSNVQHFYLSNGQDMTPDTKQKCNHEDYANP